MSLSIMFDTFVWFLGYDPFLHFDKKSKRNITELDVVAKTCMEVEPIMTSKPTDVKITLIHPDVQIEFHIKSENTLTVAEFIELVNSNAKDQLDLESKNILVKSVMLKNAKIVILTQND